MWYTELNTNSNPCLSVKYVSASTLYLRGLWLPMRIVWYSQLLTQLDCTAGVLCYRKSRNNICPTRHCHCFQHVVKILEPVPMMAWDFVETQALQATAPSLSCHAPVLPLLANQRMLGPMLQEPCIPLIPPYLISKGEPLHIQTLSSALLPFGFLLALTEAISHCRPPSRICPFQGKRILLQWSLHLQRNGFGSPLWTAMQHLFMAYVHPLISRIITIPRSQQKLHM